MVKDGWKPNVIVSFVARHTVFCILATVILVETLLFVGYHRERWVKAIQPLGTLQTATGEGLVIRSDGLGYYAWLRSLLIDGDWSFDNEFDDHNPLGDFVTPVDNRTENGRRRNQWSVGPACVWSLLVVPGHYFLSLWGNSSWPTNGYSMPYQLLVGLATLLPSMFGLWLLYRIARLYASPERSAWTAAFLTLGTTIVYYSALEVSMAHGLGTVALAALVCYWLETYGSDSSSRWGIVGILVGIAALMRWQLITYAVLPIGEWLLLVIRKSPNQRPQLILRLGVLLGLAGSGVVIAFIPQLIAWRCVYGQWLASPLKTGNNWGNPAIWQILFSQDRGLFNWTPLALASLVGATMFFRLKWLSDSARQSYTLLLVAFFLQVYVLAALWGEEVSLAVSYGFRPLTESLVVLVPGLALLSQQVSWPRFQFFFVGGWLLVFWNLALISQYRYGWIPADAGADFQTRIGNVLQLMLRKKFLFLEQAAVGPILLGMIFLLGQKQSIAGGRVVRFPFLAGVFKEKTLEY